MECIQCDKEFNGRADAKYCSDACRKKYVRANAKVDIKEIKPDTKADKSLKVDNPNVRDNISTPSQARKVAEILVRSKKPSWCGLKNFNPNAEQEPVELLTLAEKRALDATRYGTGD